MINKRKSEVENEIDLVDAMSIILKNKFKILLSTFLPATIFFLYFVSQGTNAPLFKSVTEIEPLSILDDLEYKNYNGYINNYKNYHRTLNRAIKNAKEGNFVSSNLEQDDSETSFLKIDRVYLMGLFIEKLGEEEFIIDTIKKYGLIKKENFESIKEYDSAILKTASSFELSSSRVAGKILPSWKIHFQTNDKDNFENFLKTLDNSVNLEIQKYLKDYFYDSLENERIFQKYKIEDIDINIGIRSSNLSKNEASIDQLKLFRQNIIESKSIQRLEDRFNDTPVIKSKRFYASKINIKSTKYQQISGSKSDKILLKVIIIAMLGALLGIFYVLVLYKVKK